MLQQQTATDPDKIAAISYCFGGRVVLNMARAGTDIDGVASFHGSLTPTEEATPGSVTTKILVLNGADYEFINYPGTMHSFTNPAATELGEKFNMPLAYNEQADEQSWEKLREFLASLWPQE